MISTLHLFNPDNDLALANNNENYQAPASARQMADDLAVLPAWWAERGDKVLVPSIREAENWQTEVGGLLPGVEWYSLRQVPEIERVKAWGWNPALRKHLSLWGVGDKALPSPEQIECFRALSSRLSAVRLLPELMFSNSFCGKSVYCTTEQEVESALTAYPKTMLKAPYSSSGKGLRWGHAVYEPVLANWCRRILKSQGGVVVEPLYNKVEDFAMEFYAEGGNVRFAGYSLFHTDSNGAYEGNSLVSDQEIETLLCEKIERTALLALKSALPSLLSDWLHGSGYQGYLGVDMMLCSFTEPPYLRIHPCVEINLRMNMGVVARLFYDHYVTNGARGLFVIDYQGNNELLQAEHHRLKSEHPLCIANGRIQSGYLSLVPVTQHARYRAYVLVG